MKTIRILLALLLVGAAIINSGNLSAQGREQEQIERWDHRHPEASRALGEWVKAFPQDAHYIFEWDAHRPERSREMVIWAIEHPGENLALFHAQHRDWPEMDEIERTHKAGTEAFFIWCRNHGPAARALVAHPAGLRWAGDHLYKDYLTMEHPNR